MLITMDSLDRLLTPIEEAAPCGIYLKGERALFRPLRNQFNIAQTSFRKLSQSPDPSEIDDLVMENGNAWAALAEQLVDVTASQSKDLELMSWLAVSQLFSSSPLEGFAASLQLIRRCVTDYWESVQPQTPENKLRAADDAGKRKERFELTLRPLLQLLGENEETGLAVTPLRMLPLIDDIDFVFYQNADRHMSKAELHEKVKAAMSWEKEDVLARVHQYQAVLDALDALEQALGENAKAEGIAAPSCRFLKQQVSHNLNAIRSLTEGLLVPWPLDQAAKPLPTPAPVVEEVAVTEDTDAAAASATGAEPSPQSIVADAMVQPDMVQAINGAAPQAGMVPTAPQQIYDRDQAFAQLRLIADYFARTEPQSPVSYLIEKAIRWGYTPLQDLMQELLAGNQNQLARIDELTGMQEGNRIEIPTAPAKGIVAPPQPELAPVHPAITAQQTTATVATAQPEPVAVQPAPAPVAPVAPVVPAPVASASVAEKNASGLPDAFLPKTEPVAAEPATDNEQAAAPAVNLPTDLVQAPAERPAAAQDSAPNPFGNLTELM